MKRPMVIFFVLYLIGLLLASINQYKAILFIAFSIIIMATGYFYKTYLKVWILCLPFICFFAFFWMNNTVINMEQNHIYTFENRVNATIVGEVKSYNVSNNRSVIIIESNRIEINGEQHYDPLSIRVTVNERVKVTLKDQIHAKGTLYALELPRNDGAWNEKLYYNIRNIDYRFFANTIHIEEKNKSMKQFLVDFREVLKSNYQKILPAEEAGIIIAMTLGDRTLLDEDIRTLFQQSGMIHILAISGLHITLLGVFIFSLLKKLNVSIYYAAASTIVLLMLYLLLTGSSISTQRAVFMMGVLLTAFIIGRTYDILSALAFAGFFLLIKNPLYLFDVGFQLSFVAIMGITLLTPHIEGFFRKKNKFITLTSASIAAYISTTPIIAYYYFEIPMYSIVTNILIIPLLTILVPLALFSGLVSIFSLTIGRLSIGLVYFILQFYQIISEWITNLPFNTYLTGRPHWGWIVLFYAIIGLMIYFKNNKTIQRYVAIGTVFLVILFKIMEPNYLEVHFIDVGQGDSIFIKTSNNKHIIVDGGGSIFEEIGTRRLLPFLKYNKIKRIDYMFLTHSDLDHIQGLIEIIDEIQVNYLVVPKTDFRNPLFDELLDKAKTNDVKVIEILKDDMFIIGNTQIRCLFPKEDTMVRGNNDYSLVLSLDYKEVKVLLTGDIEKEQEKVLVDYVDQHQILKVPHHGSKTSSTDDFLQAIQPRVAIISSGVYNTYGHPHQEVIDRYHSYDTIIYNTADDGAIKMVTDGKTLRISTKLPRKE